jgi:hypothetical protein
LHYFIGRFANRPYMAGKGTPYLAVNQSRPAWRLSSKPGGFKGVVTPLHGV